MVLLVCGIGVQKMANENTVTIPIEEYFDLRQKAEMNSFLMVELGRMNERLNGLDSQWYRLEEEIRRIRDGK